MNNVILVIGEQCEDVYIYGSTPRLCPEAPVPVFVAEHTVKHPGMAANVAANLRAIRIPADFHTHPEVITKTRFVETTKNHLLLRADDDVKVTPFNRDLCPDPARYAAVIVSDYCKGYLSEDDLIWITSRNPRTFVDTKKQVTGTWAEQAAFIKLNRDEFNATMWTLHKFLHKIIKTCGAEGCYFIDRLYPTQSAEVMDIAGAGDTFMAALVGRWVHLWSEHTGDDYATLVVKSIPFANECARQVVQKRGTSTPEGMVA